MAKAKTAKAEDASRSEPQAAPKAKRRRRKPRRAREEFENYLIRVTGWDFYYSLHVSDPKSRWDPGPYSEIATLSLTGEIIRPENTSYKNAKVTLSARAGMMEESRPEPPRSIGTLTARGDDLEAYVFVPAERVAELAAVAQSGRVQIVHLAATRLRYRSALIVSISLDTRFDEEEW